MVVEKLVKAVIDWESSAGRERREGMNEFGWRT